MEYALSKLLLNGAICFFKLLNSQTRSTLRFSFISHMHGKLTLKLVLENGKRVSQASSKMACRIATSQFLDHRRQILMTFPALNLANIKDVHLLPQQSRNESNLRSRLQFRTSFDLEDFYQDVYCLSQWCRRKLYCGFALLRSANCIFYGL